MRTPLTCALFAVALPAAAAVHTERVEYFDGDVALQGYLAYDDASAERRPGVLLIHEWWGLTEHPQERAERLAKEGYVAFALDMYGKGVVTRDPAEAGKLARAFYTDPDLARSRAAAGLETLRNHPLCDGSRVAVLGFCFGGSMALELARSGADVRGAISFHGGLSTQRPAGKSVVKASVLVLHGADDPMVKPDQVQGFIDEMRAAGVDWQLVQYGGAVHSFTNPAAGDDPSRGSAYNADADRRSWEALLSFLDERLRR